MGYGRSRTKDVMASRRSGFQIDDTALTRIWSAHGLGSVRTTDWAGKGVNNPALVINDAYVVRFDGLINEGVSRFYGEQVAYRLLREAEIPCPEVVVLDDSKTLAPYDYMIMNKVEGHTVLDSWADMNSRERAAVATEAGALLARMHMIGVPLFGPLYGSERRFDRWLVYMMDTLQVVGQEALTDGLIDATIYDRMQRVLDKYAAVLDRVYEPRLVHWDYHFGNILQQAGKITAVLDFEWALGGDPIHDFNRRVEWDEQCPGSREWVYAGYRALHPVEADHETRVMLYELLWFLDCMVHARDAIESDLMRGRVLDRLAWLEGNGA